MSEIDEKCRFLNISNECRAIDNKLCKDIHDCYYRQLQQLKAENEELKLEVDSWIGQAAKRDEICDEWVKSTKQAEAKLENVLQENEELKRKLAYCEETEGKYSEYVYKQKLEKIDNFLSVFCSSCEYFNGRQFDLERNDYNDNICKNICPHLFKKVYERILDIIKESEE